MTLLALDLDGTLITCRERQCAVAAHVAAAHAAAFDPEVFWRAKRHGATTRDALRRCGNADTVATTMADDWRARIEDPQWLELDTVHEGVEALLDDVRRNSIGVWVLTARQYAAAARRQIRRLGLFPYLLDMSVVSPTLASAEKSRLLRSRRPMGFVGDTESDLQAARSAVRPFASVAYGQRAPSFLKAHGATEVYTSLAAAVESLMAVRRV